MSTDTEEPKVEPDPQVATWLELVAPRTLVADEVLSAHLVAMAVATTRQSRVVERRRRKVLSSILAPVFLVGATGVAVAATSIDWSSFWGASTTSVWADWAQSPDATIKYTLPGGGSCELRLGRFQYSPDPNRPAGISADPGSVDAALEYVRSADVLADSDIDGTIEENRSEQNFAEDDSGSLVPFGYGTDNYNADVEYNLAIKEAVPEAITAHLATLGIPSTGLGFQSQEQCLGNAQ